jgi:hypothetical protein
MSPVLLGICVVLAIAAGWWVGAQARARTKEPKSLAGKARSAARRSLGSLLKELVGRDRESED